jgi:4-amino-4-deoxy-L-arabinose transferase-like glycosyltransferase
VILAAFPAFVFIALQPMSDVLATCWALAAIWAALRTRRHAGWALLAGAALGAAVLVRPIGILLLIPILLGLRLKPKILLLFILGGLPPAGIFCAYNIAAYGHPLQVGYTAMGIQVLVKLSGFTDRFGFYVYWLVMTSGPLLLGWLAVVANRKIGWKERTLLITCLAAFLLFYSCYDIYDAWWYTRFLLPGIPAMILGALLATRDAVGRWRWLAEKRRRLNLRGVVGLALLIIVLGFELYTLRHFNVLSLGAGEAVHAVSCRWADRVLPDQALVVAMEMSGALKFYANRPSVRWDYTSAEQWQLLKERAAEKGYRWYALLMSHEVALAQQRLPGSWIELGKVGQVGLWQIEP